jgi:hypothetical protein
MLLGGEGNVSRAEDSLSTLGEKIRGSGSQESIMAVPILSDMVTIYFDENGSLFSRR